MKKSKSLSVAALVESNYLLMMKKSFDLTIKKWNCFDGIVWRTNRQRSKGHTQGWTGLDKRHLFRVEWKMLVERWFADSCPNWVNNVIAFLTFIVEKQHNLPPWSELFTLCIKEDFLSLLSSWSIFHFSKGGTVWENRILQNEQSK